MSELTDSTHNKIENSAIPDHIAIIMDGNNRWAKNKHLPGVAGHKAGATAVRRTVEAAVKANVKVLTLFAFSSENWKRPRVEVDALMSLFMRVLKKEVRRMNEHQIRLRVMGDVSAFSPSLQKQIAIAETETSNNEGLQLVIAANYGGRWDIAEAAKSLCEQVIAKEIQIEDITENSLAQYIQLADLPAPDVIIRTSGEKRLSNFLLWQAAYSEFVFVPVLWPDFGHEDFEQAIFEFQQRQRRYGGR